MRSDKIIKIGFLVVGIIFFVKFFFGFFSVYGSFFTVSSSRQEILNMTFEEKEKYGLVGVDINILSDAQIKEISKNIISNSALEITILIFFVCLHEMSPIIIVVLIVCSVKIFDKKITKKKLSVNDLKNDSYWRDILNNYSVDVLSFIDNYKLVYPDVLIAMLLQLECKGVISFDENIIVVNKKDCVNLTNSEKYILSRIFDGKLEVDYSYDRLVKKESFNNDLVVNVDVSEKKYNWHFIKNIVITAIVLVLLCFGFVMMFIKGNGFVPAIGIFGLVLIFNFMIYYPIYKFITYFVCKSKVIDASFRRTEKGEEINKKLEGLKNYLNDFSLMDERDKNELVLWDEYLIYSVMFGQNREIIEKYKNIIL